MNHHFNKKKRPVFLPAFSIAFLFAIMYTTVFASSEILYIKNETPSPHEFQPEASVATVTGYTASVEETDDEPGITASGTKTTLGGVACPIRLPFGTRIEIMGKVFTCNDRMASRFRGDEFYDVLFSTKKEALEFGRKVITIKILK